MTQKPDSLSADMLLQKHRQMKNMTREIPYTIWCIGVPFEVISIIQSLFQSKIMGWILVPTVITITVEEVEELKEHLPDHIEAAQGIYVEMSDRTWYHLSPDNPQLEKLTLPPAPAHTEG